MYLFNLFLLCTYMDMKDLTCIMMNYGNHIQSHTRKKLKNKKKRGDFAQFLNLHYIHYEYIYLYRSYLSISSLIN
jgi:hypothetical protein